MTEREPLSSDEFREIDKVLLANDFAYYDDWEYGPVTCWQTFASMHTLELMRVDTGYWVHLVFSGGGARTKMHMGLATNAADIIAIRDALRRLV